VFKCSVAEVGLNWSKKLRLFKPAKVVNISVISSKSFVEKMIYERLVYFNGK